MNPRHDPLDADERALAALLAREESPGPSPQLDARILAAARGVSNPATTLHRPRPRWIAAMSIAATLVLVVGIAWRLRPLPQRPMASEAPVAMRVSATASAEASRMAAPGEARTAPASAAVTEPAPVDAVRRVAADARVEAPPPEPPVASAKPAPMEAAAPRAFPAPPPPPVAAAAPAVAQPAMPAAAPAANVSGEMAKQARAQDRAETLDRIDAAAAADAAASGAALPSREVLDEEPPATADSPQVQDAWLQRIRDLLSAGDADGARSSLAEFRRRYPDYALPEDLRRVAQP
jgi:hypothetical protein